MVVRETPYIYGDHRLLEYKLLDLEPNLKFRRMTLTEIGANCFLERDTFKLYV